MKISWENTKMKNTNNFRDCHNREWKYSVETGDVQIFRHIFKSVRDTVTIIKKFAIQKISSKYFERMNLIGFQEFSALAPLLFLLIFSQIWTFFNVMTLLLYEFFLWNWEKCGWLRDINKPFFLETRFPIFQWPYYIHDKIWMFFIWTWPNKSFFPTFQKFFTPLLSQVQNRQMSDFRKYDLTKNPIFGWNMLLILDLWVGG